MAKLAVQRFVCSGDYQENCYLVFPDEPESAASARPCWIIDPGFGAAAVVRAIGRQRLAPEALVLTHGHLDHIGGIPELRAAYPGLPIWIGRAEADALQSAEMNLSAEFGMPLRLSDRPTRLLDDGEVLSLGAARFEAVLVRGHSAGGMCYHCRRAGELFAGDVLFAGSIGRSDLAGGDGERLVADIRRRLLVLDGQTRVWPGHGPATTIGAEKAGNPWLAKGDSY